MSEADAGPGRADTGTADQALVRVGGIVLLVLAAAGCTHVLTRHAGPPRRQPADNSFCLVCHLDFGLEAIARTHEQAGWGCTACHGPSRAHAADEAARHAPDIMYPRADIEGRCRQCHVPTRLASACRAAEAGRICTDCHDSHHVDDRKRKWDRRTGELLWARDDDGMGM